MSLILVTGADGQLGRALRQAQDGTLRQVQEPDPGSGGLLSLSKQWMFAGRRDLDVASREAVERFFAAHRPAVVVNCAAFTNVDRAETERAAAMAVNRDSARFLAEACLEADAALVHISTDFVFDGRAQLPYNEQDTPAPVNFYGESKLAGERAVAASGCRGAVVRTSWLWSLGAGFPAAILRRAAVAAASPTAGREIRVVADQVGTPTAASSLADAIIKIISEPLSVPAGLWHFCDGPILSRAEWARAIIKEAGLDCRVVEVTSDEFKTVAKRPRFSALDANKFHTRYER